MTDLSYAVTGATGQLATLDLLARGVPAANVVAVVRDRDLAACGVQIREADYADPHTLDPAFAGIDRLLLISSSAAGHRLAHHTNAIEAAHAAGVTRIAYTSILNADTTRNPLAGEHQATEQVLRGSGVAFTLLRNGWYTENYTSQLDGYLDAREIVGAAGHGRISAATRADLATAATTALLDDTTGNHVYELGGAAFTLDELARVISDIAGTPVTYRDLPEDAYARHLQDAGLDDTDARFIAALDASINNGELHTDSQDLDQMLGRPPHC